MAARKTLLAIADGDARLRGRASFPQTRTVMSDTPNNWQFRMAEHAAITLLCPECSKKEAGKLDDLRVSWRGGGCPHRSAHLTLIDEIAAAFSKFDITVNEGEQPP
jgi:hypothetical protein